MHYGRPNVNVAFIGDRTPTLGGGWSLGGLSPADRARLVAFVMADARRGLDCRERPRVFGPAAAPGCYACGKPLRPGGYRPTYAPLRHDAGPLLCLPCDAAAWARVDAACADMPGQQGNTTTNVWD